MMMLQALTVVAALAIVVQCICALNHMTLNTRHSVRVAYLTLLLCSTAEVLSPLYEADASNAFLLLAMALYIGVNHRRAYASGVTT